MGKMSPGKTATFEVRLNAVEAPRLPEVDTEFADRWVLPMAILKECAVKFRLP